jgi:hypothetical protein
LSKKFQFKILRKYKKSKNNMQNFNTFAGDVGPNDGGEETG